MNSGTALAWFNGTKGTGDTWSNLLDTTLLPDGHYNVSVRSTDSSGNQRVLLDAAVIVIDNTLPEVSLTAPVGGNFSGSLEFSARSTDGLSGVENVRFSYRSLNGKIRWFSGREAEKGVWHGSLDTTRIPNGSYSLGVSSTDFAGNQRSDNGVVEIVVSNMENASSESDSNATGLNGEVSRGFNGTRQAAFWDRLDAGSTAALKITRPGMVISLVEFVVSEDVRDVELVVSSQPERPSGISHDYGGAVYSYVTMDNSGLYDSRVSSVTLDFSVEKNFLSENNASPDDVILFYYDDGWIELSAFVTGSDDLRYHYEVQSYDLSSHVIALKETLSYDVSEPAGGKSPLASENERASENLPKGRFSLIPGAFYAAIAIILVLLLVSATVVVIHLRSNGLFHEVVKDPDDSGDEHFANSLEKLDENSEYRF